MKRDAGFECVTGILVAGFVSLLIYIALVAAFIGWVKP